MKLQIRKKTDLVTEVEVKLQKEGTNGEVDVILVAEGGKNGCVPVENVVGVADNVEKVSEAVEESKKEVAITPEVVEPVFSSLELFGPDFEKPNFKIDEVIAADFDLAVPENAEAFVLQVAREISKDNVPNDTMEEIENAFEKSMDVEMKDAGVYKSKVVVLRNVGGSGTSGLGKMTPALPKRSIKLPVYLRSPFLQHFGSSSKETIEPANVARFKGICPLDNNIGNLPDMDLSLEYYSWLDKGLLMNKNKRKFYSKEDNAISPPIKLGCEIISEKTWFHTIEYGSSNFSNSHVDVFFYYLRKLSKYNAECKMNFTTSDCKFQKALGSLYSDILDISESDNIQSKITAKKGILDVLNGVALPFSTPWYLVDNVLVPIWLAEKKHWVLAVIHFKERMIRVRNTLACEGIALIVRNALLPLSTILPHYLLLNDFYSRTDINFSAKCYTEKSNIDCFRTIMQNDYICGQSNDSGVTMISIAEYLVLDKDFPEDSFDVAVHRSRISFSFYAYGMAKQIYAYESEHDYFDDGRGDPVVKRTRAGRVQTRKRNLENVSLKRKKERKG